MNTKVIVLVVVVALSAGIVIGYLIPRDVHLQVIEASGKYVEYFHDMKDSIYPFNETDNVTIFIHGNIININHTQPNDQGIRFFILGFNNDGFFSYITQIRERP